jgi:pre-mRNA-processing factor 6
MEWAMLEWDEAGNVDRARQLFQAGAGVPPSYQHPPLYQAWAEREAAAGEEERAQELTRAAYEVAKAAQLQQRGKQIV